MYVVMFGLAYLNIRLQIYIFSQMKWCLSVYPGWCAGKEDRAEQGAHHGDLQAVHGGVRRRGDVPHSVHQAEQGCDRYSDARISTQYSENGLGNSHWWEVIRIIVSTKSTICIFF